MFSHSFFRTVALRLFAVCAFLAGASIASADIFYFNHTPSFSRDFVLTGDSENPARREVAVSSGAGIIVVDEIEWSEFRFAWQLEVQNANSSWSIVPLAGGNNTVYSVSEAIALDDNPNTQAPQSIVLDHSGTLKPATTLDPYVNYRIVSKLERKPLFGEWAVVGDTKRSGTKRLHHFTNTASNDSALNVITTAHTISIVDPFALNDASPAFTRGFRVKVNATAKRWDAYNFARSSSTVHFSVKVEMFEKVSGNLVATSRTNEGKFSSLVPNYEFSGSTKVPSSKEVSRLLRVFPSVQIDPVANDYVLVATISHTERTNVIRAGNSVTRENTQVFHFNGAVDFNGVSAVMTSFPRSSLPSTTNFSSFVQVQLEGASGHLANSPGHTWTTSSAVVVRLYRDGSARVFGVGGAVPVTSSEQFDRSVLHNVLFQRNALQLTNSGLAGMVTAILPQGLSMASDSRGKLSMGLASFSPVSLNSNLEPVESTLTFTPATPFYLFEETKPVGIKAQSITWQVTTGEFDINTSGPVIYAREAQVGYLEGAPITPVEKVKPDNSGYYASVAAVIGNNITARTGTNGSALLDVAFTFTSGQLTTHFPYGSGITYEGGIMMIEDNAIVSGKLEDVDPLLVFYNTACADADCAGGSIHADAFILNIPTLSFTPDGGLTGSGAIMEMGTYDGRLRWGFVQAMSQLGGTQVFAHSLDSFTEGTFHATGHFFKGQGGIASDFVPGASGDIAATAGPANVHLAAVLGAQGIARPGSPEDVAGTHNYAGINLKVAGEEAISATSTIAGESVSYDPRKCDKFYARLSGVTGTLEATPGSFPGSMVLHNYPFEFKYYGLGFLDSTTSPERSFTSGSVTVPYPSDETFEFMGLSFTCLGALDSARLPEGGLVKSLKFWNADIDVFTLDFVTSESCDPSAPAYAALGVRAFSTVLDQPLHGVIGIRPTGELITQTFSDNEGLVTEITSRLRLPNNLKLSGPAEEVYELTAISEAYFNDYNAASAKDTMKGRLNFAVKMNVPFFEDLKAHVQTTASKIYQADAIYHLAGGWTDSESDNTFFTAQFFDSDNRAYPSEVSEDLYFNRNGAGADRDYLIRAQQDWLNVVPFDYPLEWSPSLRSFKAYEPTPQTNLLVVKIDHQLEYLSAENAEITFGAVYQGMPRINLANFAFNQINEGTGTLQALTEALQAEAVGALEGGLNSLDKLLKDQIDDLLEEFVGYAVDPVIESLFDELEQASQNVNNANDWKDEVEATTKEFLIGNTSNQSQNIQHVIQQLSQEVGNASSLIHTVDSSLEEVQLALRVIYGEIYRVGGGVSLDPPGTVTPGNTINGLLTLDGDGQYQLVERLVSMLISEVANDAGNEMATILNNLLEGSTAELNRLINEQIEKVQPTLDQVKVVIEALDGKIQAVRAQLETGGEFIEELNAILSAADAQVVAATELLQETVESFVIADIPSPDQFVEISEEELKLRIRTEIRDMIGELRFIREYQLALRQRLYDIDLAVKEGIDTAFGQVNGVIKNLLREYLTQFDDQINGFLGDLGETLGAGELDGYAHINGDALRLLRLDAYLQLNVPDELEFRGYLQIKQLNSEGSGSCSAGSATAVVNEVTMGALGVPVSWISPGMEIDVEAKASFVSSPSFKAVGLGGSLEMVGGEFEFEAFAITDFGAAMSFGSTENYIAAKAGMRFQSYTVAGGVFFGQTCSIAPLKLVNEQVGSILGEPDPTFTGAYVYGEAHIPVSEALLGIPASCMFKITAGVGLGAFYFVEGPTYGGQMLLAASGEALCLVSIKGDVSLVGVKVADDFRFNGRGRLSGRVGSCPFCVKFGKSLELEYRNDRWKFEL